MKRPWSLEIWIRRAVGMVGILGIVTILGGWDMNLRRSFSFQNAANASAAESRPALTDEGAMPDLGSVLGAGENGNWLNSVPLNRQSLRGKVVLVDFWTYSCINSLRNLPYMQSWATKYKDAGLVVIGVHTPEFSFEKEHANVEVAVRDYNLTYPIAIDSGYRIWEAFNNDSWPADYFVDGKGRIRYVHVGEGDYAASERVIRELLKENGAGALPEGALSLSAPGVEAPPSIGTQESPETYVGYRRAENFSSPGRLAGDAAKVYSPPASPDLNQWGLGGSWNVGAESAVLQGAPGKIVFRFHSRDLHLVLGPAADGKPVRFKVKLDDAAPGNDHGTDTAPDGSGQVQWIRLYQLVRQKGEVKDRTFEIDFLDPGVRAFVFTFG